MGDENETKTRKVGPSYHEHISMLNDAQATDLKQTLDKLEQFAWVKAYVNTKRYPMIKEILEKRTGQ